MPRPFAPQPKPSVSARLLRRQSSQRRQRAEDAIKAEVRARDGYRCRYPFCPLCRAYPGLALECAHVLQAKGMGGDKRLRRSRRHQLMLLDVETHRRQERHEIVIVPVDPARGTDGPCEFWADDPRGEQYLVARELAPGGPYERD
jgi:hypothetical protein